MKNRRCGIGDASIRRFCGSSEPMVAEVSVGSFFPPRARVHACTVSPMPRLGSWLWEFFASFFRIALERLRRNRACWTCVSHPSTSQHPVSCQRHNFQRFSLPSRLLNVSLFSVWTMWHLFFLSFYFKFRATFIWSDRLRSQ